MKNTGFLILLLLAAACGENEKESELTLEQQARTIHESVLTVDTHADIDIANFTDSINYTQRLETQVNLPKMEEGGLDVAWLIVYTGQDTLTPEGYRQAEVNAMSKFEAIHRLCEEIAPDQIGLARTSDEARRIHESGRKVAMIGVENAYPMGTDLGNFEKYERLGARYVSLSHNGHSQFSDSNTGEADSLWLHNGLSELGKKAVIEMNRVGMMIDISHPSKAATLQMMELSETPVIASHSSARALCDHSRNLDDEQLMKLRENGGVVQTVAFPSYLKVENSEDASVSDLADHIDYMVDLIGIDHVGISSDFDGGGGIVGWADASETFNVTLELVRRGYTEAEIRKLWGGNLLRVLDEVQAHARSVAQD